VKCTAVCPVTLAVPPAGLLALAAEQLVASLGSLRKRGLYNSPFSITLLPTPKLPKLILQGSSISVQSFMISPQSEIFCHIFRLSRWS